MYKEHMKMHTMIKNISLKDAHPYEPLHERSVGCAVRIKIGLYFHNENPFFKQNGFLFIHNRKNIRQRIHGIALSPQIFIINMNSR